LVFNQIKTKLHFVGTTEDFITPVKSKIIQNENRKIVIANKHPSIQMISEKKIIRTDV
jgi:hypothetical protein